MFTRRPARGPDSFSTRYGAGKSVSKTRRSFKEHVITAGLQRAEPVRPPTRSENTGPPVGSTLTSPIITLCVGPEQRLFAGHEDVLCRSPFFQAICIENFLDGQSKRIDLPEELPEILSSILEYLYKGDYYPRLLHNKRRDTWELEDGGTQAESTVYHHATNETLLKDTVIYCAADRYGLEELKRLALRKQGLQSGIHISTVLASARWTYAHTPDTDSKMRAHYLALIIRSRNNFKKSATLQSEMQLGGKMFFDLFVAMCNHMDDLSTGRSPLTR